MFRLFLLLWLKLLLLWLLLLLQGDGHTHVSYLQMVAAQAVELGCALGAAGRPALSKHKEGVLRWDVDSHFALLLPDSEVKRHKTRFLLAGPDVHHHAGINFQPTAHLGTTHKVLSLQVFYTFQFPGGQLDDGPLHEVRWVAGCRG